MQGALGQSEAALIGGVRGGFGVRFARDNWIYREQQSIYTVKPALFYTCRTPIRKYAGSRASC